MSLGEALGWKYSHTPGICTRGGKLTKWPEKLGPPPSEAAQDAIVAEFEMRRGSVAAEREIDSQRLLGALVAWLAPQLGKTPAEAKAEIVQVLKSLHPKP